MLILRREHHSSAIWQVLHKTWATLIMLNTSSWILKKSFLWGLIRGALEMILKNSSPYAQVSNILFCKERQNWKPIYSGYPDAPLFNQEKSKLMQTKGQLSKNQSCFFVCTTFDSFLNDLFNSINLKLPIFLQSQQTLFIGCANAVFVIITHLFIKRRSCNRGGNFNFFCSPKKIFFF